MTVLLSRGYMGRNAGETAQFSKAAEDTLVASGLATVALDTTLTTGAYTQNTSQGKAAIAAGQSSVVITNSLVDINTKVFACVAQSTADTTLLRVERIVVSNGSFQIFGTANATATTVISWTIVDDPNTSGT
jgi:hypothetical protein